MELNRELDYGMGRK